MSESRLTQQQRLFIKQRANGCCEYCLSQAKFSPDSLLNYSNLTEILRNRVFDQICGRQGNISLKNPVSRPINSTESVRSKP